MRAISAVPVSQRPLRNNMAAVIRKFCRFSNTYKVHRTFTSGVIKNSVRSNSSLVTLDIEDSVAVMTLKRKPVNSFSVEFLEEMISSLESLENNNSVRGLILTSGCKNVFSAGLDLVNELYNANPERLRVYWGSFREMFMQLYGSRLVTIAAINGHAIAGGCVLASGCDYRIMSPNFTIGLNETIAGIQVPPWVLQSFINLVGYREAERVSLLGITFPGDVALTKGVVDRIVPEENVLAESHKEMQRWLKIPDPGRVLTKKNLRMDFLQRMKDTEDQDIQGFTEYILQDATQKLIQDQIDRIKKKSNK